MKFIILFLFVLVFVPGSAAAADYPSIVSVHPADEGASIAIEIPTAGSAALAGLRWFHNDGEHDFPKVVVIEGEAGVAPDLTNPGLILQEVSGVSMGWGQLIFANPVTSSTGTAFAVFFLPEGESTTSLGTGGGPGIGLMELEADNPPFYLSSDALNWVQFDAAYKLGVEPIYTALRGTPVTIKEVGQRIDLHAHAAPEDVIVYSTALAAPTPNPFNPRVQLSFSLASPTLVHLKVYDMRGRLIKTVVSDNRATGQHTEIWDGDDENGRKVASGVYFARFEAGKTLQVRRMVLLR
ncbi:hypothetical protein DRQ53_09195 [bacterium]|nr:MAG: hypothetical protein DRQ32_03575 [bacterium]RKZ15364.1 MAG: hypothetical protein DRQ53_09195 [bacterium]